MTTLTPRQSTKVKAAFSLIAIHGHNPRTVQQAAQSAIAAGTPANVAYTQTLNAFADRVPAIRSTLELALDLIHNSDDATVATYDHALSAYNDSGDPAHLDSIAPMILEDAKALAIRNGEVSEADAAGWEIDDALGVDHEAFSATPDVPDAASTPPVTSAFQFASPAQQYAQEQAAQEAQGADNWDRYGCNPRSAQQAPSAPVGDGPTAIWGAAGVRIILTEEQARREAGVPLGPNPSF